MKRLCQCGTCAEAVDAAHKYVAQMIENDCPVWAMQVLTAIQYARLMLLAGMANQDKARSPVTKLFEAETNRVMSEAIMDRLSDFQKLRDKMHLEKNLDDIQAIEELLKSLGKAK